MIPHDSDPLSMERQDRCPAPESRDSSYETSSKIYLIDSETFKSGVSTTDDESVLCWHLTMETNMRISMTLFVSGVLSAALVGSLTLGCSRCSDDEETDNRGMTSVRLSMGGLHGCFVEPAGSVRCWGSNRQGQLGLGVEGGESPLPERVPGLAGIVAIAAGATHTCALNRQRRVTCWGNNASGQLGDGTFEVRTRPEFSRADDVLELRAGGDNTCARTRDGRVFCWGCNLAGQLGNGRSTADLLENGGELGVEAAREINQPSPVRVVGLVETTEVTVGTASTCNNHVCALGRLGKVRCWGDSRFGGLGDGTPPPSRLPSSRAAPTTVPGLDPTKSLGTGGGHTCAVLRSSTLACWGRNDYGQLGDGSTSMRRAPVIVPDLDQVEAVALGGSHTCALLRGGRVSCWGRNHAGQLGTGDEEDRHSPTLVDGLPSVEQISAGDLSTCALTSEGELHCWGRGHQITPTKLF